VGRLWATHRFWLRAREAATAAAERDDAAGAAGGAEAGMILAVEPPLVPLPTQER